MMPSIHHMLLGIFVVSALSLLFCLFLFLKGTKLSRLIDKSAHQVRQTSQDFSMMSSSLITVGERVVALETSLNSLVNHQRGEEGRSYLTNTELELLEILKEK